MRLDKRLSDIRSIDFDDMIIGSLLYEDMRLVEIASHLKVKGSTITQRVKKYEDIWCGSIVRTVQCVSIHEDHRDTFKKMRMTVNLLLDRKLDSEITPMIRKMSDSDKVKMFRSKDY